MNFALSELHSESNTVMDFQSVIWGLQIPD